MIYRGNDKERKGKEMNSKEGVEVRGLRLFYGNNCSFDHSYYKPETFY